MMNNMNGFIQRLQQFKNQFNGNPQQQIQQMLNSGKITQAQYDHAVKQANQIANVLGVPHP